MPAVALAVKLIEVDPLGTRTLEGTVTTVEDDFSVTDVPPAGAAAESDTVQEVAPLVVIEPAVQVSDVNVIAVAAIPTLVDCCVPFKDAATVAVCEVAVAEAVAVNVAVLLLGPTVTNEGAVSEALEEIATAAPPTGAAFESVTEHVVLAPGAMLTGAHEIAVTVGEDVKEIEADFEAPPNEAETVAD